MGINIYNYVNKHRFNEFEQPSQTPSDLYSDEYWKDHFKKFCTDECLLRYLRAHKGDVEQANMGLIKTLFWFDLLKIIAHY